jgi:hypothetical protein
MLRRSSPSRRQSCAATRRTTAATTTKMSDTVVASNDSVSVAPGLAAPTGIHTRPIVRAITTTSIDASPSGLRRKAAAITGMTMSTA